MRSAYHLSAPKFFSELCEVGGHAYELLVIVEAFQIG